MPQLTSLQILTIKDHRIASLGNCINLRKIYCEDCHIAEGAWDGIFLPQLEDLCLKRCLTDRLSLLQADKLRHLDLEGTNLSDWDLSPFRSLNNLGTSRTKVTVEDLAPIRSLKHIKQLWMNHCDCLHSLDILSGFTDLHALQLRCCGATDLSPLMNLTKLNSLLFSSLGTCQPQEFTKLTLLTKLETLDIRNNNLELGQMSELQNLLPQTFIPTGSEGLPASGEKKGKKK